VEYRVFIIVYNASFENNFVGAKPRKSNQYVSTMLNKSLKVQCKNKDNALVKGIVV
jgi:hypothetical protein